MFLRPVNAENGNCMHTLCIVNNAEDLLNWIRVKIFILLLRVK